MRFFFFLCFLLAAFAATAQFNVRFVVRKLPAYHKTSDPIYLAGNFNGWNPKDERFRMQNGGITIELKKGMYEYKLTTGGWENVESGNDGAPVPNHTLAIESDTTVFVDIDHWANHFPRKSKETTASKNVHVLDTAFYIPQLDRHRRVWIYLPDSYATSKQKYPVLYMQDCQNVFDDATASFGEWGVDEALDTLGQRYGEMIVVAIDHGAEKRINEYSPYHMEKYGKGEGDAYVDFLAHTLIPYINRHYRTKKSAKYTSVAGSSMGGLISLYAILKYPNKFGAAGVFSPALWVAPQIYDYAEKRSAKVKGRIYFYAGGAESQTMVPDMSRVFEKLNGRSKTDLKTHIRPEGKHSESVWREEFPSFYQWLAASAQSETED